MQAPFIPSTVSTLQVLQARKPQLIMRSSDTSQYAQLGGSGGDLLHHDGGTAAGDVVVTALAQQLGGRIGAEANACPTSRRRCTR